MSIILIINLSGGKKVYYDGTEFTQDSPYRVVTTAKKAISYIKENRYSIAGIAVDMVMGDCHIAAAENELEKLVYIGSIISNQDIPFIIYHNYWIDCEYNERPYFKMISTYAELHTALFIFFAKAELKSRKSSYYYDRKVNDGVETLVEYRHGRKTCNTVEICVTSFDKRRLRIALNGVYDTEDLIGIFQRLFSENSNIDTLYPDIKWVDLYFNGDEYHLNRYMGYKILKKILVANKKIKYAV